MGDDAIANSVLDQFNRALKMFRESILAFPEGEWRKGDIDYLRPAGVAYHVAETIDFYTSSKTVEQFPWGSRFGVDWEDGQSERLPIQSELVGYLDEVEGKLTNWIESVDLSSEEAVYPWTGPIVLSRAIYVLRNTQHHLSEMALELTRRGYAAPEWH